MVLSQEGANRGRARAGNAVGGLIAACLAFTLASTVTAQVRNDRPQRSVSAADHEDRIYFPARLTRRADESAAEHGSLDDLLQLFMHYHTSRRYEDAAEVALRLVELRPERPMTHYNLACVMARLHRLDDAFAALDRAIECGWRNVAHTLLDTDLQAVRNDGRFAARLEVMQTLIDQERLRPQPLREDDWQAIADDLRRDAPPMLDQAGVPGAAFALIHDGRVVWTGAFGVREAGTDEAHRTTDHYRLTAPARLSTLIVAARQQAEGRLRVAVLLQHVAELEVVAAQGGRSIRSVSGPSSRRGRPGRNFSVDNRVAWPVAGASIAQPPAANETLLLARESEPFRLFRLALELSIEDGLLSRCRADVFDALDLADTSHQPPGDASLLVHGHTELGTPVDLPRSKGADESTLYTNLEDLARLWAALTPNPDSASDPGLAPAIAGLDTVMYGGPALGVDVRMTEHGPRVQMFETTDGQGCLLRMYPKTGRGVVIVFNSATGPMPALRLAQLALGGI